MCAAAVGSAHWVENTIWWERHAKKRAVRGIQNPYESISMENAESACVLNVYAQSADSAKLCASKLHDNHTLYGELVYYMACCMHQRNAHLGMPASSRGQVLLLWLPTQYAHSISQMMLQIQQGVSRLSAVHLCQTLKPRYQPKNHQSLVTAHAGGACT